MNRLIRFLLSALLLPSLAAAAQTSTAATGTKIQDGTGNLITQGTICFSPYNASGALTAITPSGGSPTTGPFCYTILNGAWTTFGATTPLPNLLTATPAGLNYQMVVLSQAGGTVLLVNWVTSISGATATTDTLIVGASLNSAATSSGLGTPYLACAPPASFFSTNNQTGRPNWTCTVTNGTPQWFQSGASPAPGPGQSATVPVVAQMIADAIHGISGNTPFSSTTGKLVVNTSSTFSRNGVLGDVTSLWTATGTNCGTPTNLLQINGSCATPGSGGGGSPPAGGPNDIQSNLNGTLFSADPGNFTYTNSSHQLFLINQAMIGFFNQVSSIPGFNHDIENDSSGPTDSFGNSETGAVQLYVHTWGVGKNIGNAFNTSADGWRTLTTLWIKADGFSSGIHQLAHWSGNFAGSGDSAISYAGNAEGFSPCMWTDASGEGCVGYMLNGTQHDCFANGTITSTTGTGDTNPVFSITPVNCEGANTIINDGVVMDTSVNILHTALTGTISSVWESNPFLIGTLPVTIGSASISTGMCILTAPVVQSTVPGVYQTQAFSCTVHDSHPLHAGATVIANSGGPEQCNVITVSGSGTQTGTISCAKYHQAGAYIFQGGTQGFGDFDDDMSAMGLHSALWVLGAPDADHVLIAQRIGGGFRGDGLPYRGAEPAGRTVTGGFTVHPGALCVNTNSTNSQCGLEFNTIAWGVGHTFTSPPGIPSVEVMASLNSTQSSPDSPQSGGYGLNVNFNNNTQHSTAHPFIGLGNFAPLSSYANSGSGTGWLSAPPGINVLGAMGNFAQFDMSLAPFAGDGGVPCGGATIICNKNGLHTYPLIRLYADWQGPEQIVLDGPNSQFRFRGWDLVVEGNVISNVGTFTGALSAASLSINNVGFSTTPLRINEQFLGDNTCKGEYFNMSGADWGRICATHTFSGGDEFNLTFDIGNNSSILTRSLTLRRDAANNMHAFFAGDMSGTGLTVPTASVLTSSTNNDLAFFNNTTGRLADSGVLKGALVLLNAANQFDNSTQTFGLTGSGETQIGNTGIHGINVGLTTTYRIDNFTGAIQPGLFTVSTLPAAASLTAGAMLVVSDATTFTPGTCTGGGSDQMVAVTNGSTWTCH